MAYYNYKELRDELPPEMVDKWASEDGSADCNSKLWLYAAEYIRQLKAEVEALQQQTTNTQNK